MDDYDYTSGPWEVEIDEDAEGGAFIVGPDGETIAQMSDDIMDEETVAANARLIASAPALFAACEAVLNRLTYLQEVWGKEAITESAAVALRSAIKQATGSAPPAP